MAHKHTETEELLGVFIEEFRKVSEENFAPKKRGRLFSGYLLTSSTTLFKTNKKTNQPKRQKTLAKEISQVATFISWAGEIDLRNFTIGVANRYAEALVDPDNGLISMRVVNSRQRDYRQMLHLKCKKCFRLS